MRPFQPGNVRGTLLHPSSSQGMSRLHLSSTLNSTKLMVGLLQELYNQTLIFLSILPANQCLSHCIISPFSLCHPQAQRPLVTSNCP